MKFCKLPIFHEMVLWVWTFALFVESMRKAFSSDRFHLRQLCGRSTTIKGIMRYFRWTSTDTWTTIDLLIYILFGIAFIMRLACIPDFLSIWDTNGPIATLNWTKVENVADTYFENMWDTTDENCPLYFDIKNEDSHALRYAQYFYIAAFFLATIRTLELCTASKHLGPKVKTLFGVLYDLLFFLVILSFFLVGYGVALQVTFHLHYL